MSEPVTVRQWTGKTFRIRLNRPAQGNAFSADLVRSLDEALDDAQSGDAQAVVIEGAGKHFCTGFDLSGLDAETDDTLLARFVRIELLLQRVSRMPMTTVVLGHGRVMGAGADLFAACTVRAAKAGTSFAFPGSKGFGIALGSRRLAVCVGRARAQEWIEGGRAVARDEAGASGLVNVDVERIDDAWLTEGAVRFARSAGNRWVDEAMNGNARSEDSSDLWALAHSAAGPGLRDRIAQYVRGTVRS